MAGVLLEIMRQANADAGGHLPASGARWSSCTGGSVAGCDLPQACRPCWLTRWLTSPAALHAPTAEFTSHALCEHSNLMEECGGQGGGRGESQHVGWLGVEALPAPPPLSSAQVRFVALQQGPVGAVLAVPGVLAQAAGTPPLPLPWLLLPCLLVGRFLGLALLLLAFLPVPPCPGALPADPRSQEPHHAWRGRHGAAAAPEPGGAAGAAAARWAAGERGRRGRRRSAPVAMACYLWLSACTSRALLPAAAGAFAGPLSRHQPWRPGLPAPHRAPHARGGGRFEPGTLRLLRAHGRGQTAAGRGGHCPSSRAAGRPLRACLPPLPPVAATCARALPHTVPGPSRIRCPCRKQLVYRQAEDLKKPLRVTFVSGGVPEPAQDAGGVTKELFQLLVSWQGLRRGVRGPLACSLHAPSACLLPLPHHCCRFRSPVQVRDLFTGPYGMFLRE